MRTVVLALAILAAAPSATLAYCPSVPDDAATGYVGNQASLTLCRQQELADGVRRLQQQTEFNAQLQHLQQQIRLNDQFSRAQQALPQF